MYVVSCCVKGKVRVGQFQWSGQNSKWKWFNYRPNENFNFEKKNFSACVVLVKKTNQTIEKSFFFQMLQNDELFRCTRHCEILKNFRLENVQRNMFTFEKKG